LLNLTKRVEYGLISLLDMSGRDPDSVVTASEIAAKYEIPLKLLRQVLYRLAKGQLVRSHQGVRGGYLLSRLPAEISVKDVIEVLEGPLHLVECIRDKDEDCHQLNHCKIRRSMLQLHHRVVDLLSQCTVAEISGLQGCLPLAVGDSSSASRDLAISSH
jgi:Rrf2 family protein